MLSWLVCLIFMTFGSIFTFEKPNAKNFGPYNPVWTGYEVCRGTKMRNASNTGVVIFKENGNYYGTMDFNFLFRSTIDEARIWLYSVNGDKKRLLWSYKMKDPCKHFVISEIIEKQLNAHNCAVEKAYYNRTVNFTEITSKLLGPSFFYGSYSMKTIIASKNANILCLIVYVDIVKKQDSR